MRGHDSGSLDCRARPHIPSPSSMLLVWACTLGSSHRCYHSSCVWLCPKCAETTAALWTCELQAPLTLPDQLTRWCPGDQRRGAACHTVHSPAGYRAPWSRRPPCQQRQGGLHISGPECLPAVGPGLQPSSTEPATGACWAWPADTAVSWTSNTCSSMVDGAGYRARWPRRPPCQQKQAVMYMAGADPCSD